VTVLLSEPVGGKRSVGYAHYDKKEEMLSFLIIKKENRVFQKIYVYMKVEQERLLTNTTYGAARLCAIRDDSRPLISSKKPFR